MARKILPSYLRSVRFHKGKGYGHLEPNGKIVLDKGERYEIMSYDADQKVFIIYKERYNETFNISQRIIERLAVTQRYFDRLCKKHKCHAVTTCELRARNRDRAKRSRVRKGTR